MHRPIQAITAFLQTRQPQMIEQLYKFCHINSGSTHQAGLRAMAKALTNAFKPLADSIESFPLPPCETVDMEGHPTFQSFGPALLIKKRPNLPNRVLLCGHMDTVFSIDHPFQSIRELDADRLNGPGVADMKGGLVVMLHALHAFEQLPQAKQLGWDVFINTEEELGSPASGSLLTSLASQYIAGLVYEPSVTPQGLFAKNRKGSGKITLIAKGKAAHVGRAFAEGKNAIYFLAKALVAIHHLNDQKNGIIINIGKIAGGDAVNRVPDCAVAKLDIRIQQPDDQVWVMNQLQEIITQQAEPGFSLTLHSHFGRPVKSVTPDTELLFSRLQQIGQALHLPIEWQDSGGCCDGNNLAQQGLPVIDTLGVRGGEIHTEQEYILIDSLVERASLSALLLADLANSAK